MEFITNKKDSIGAVMGLVSVVLTVVGWGVIFYFNLRQQKKLLQDTLKIKIYQELYELKKEVDSKAIILGVLFNSFSLPLREMEHASKLISCSENVMTCFNIYQSYVQKFNNEISDFTISYHNFWARADMWIGVVPKFKLAKTLLLKEFNALINRLNEHQHYLSGLSRHTTLSPVFGYSFPEEDLIKKTKIIEEDFDITVSYLDDFMGLIHNSIVTPIFGYSKKPREEFNIKKTIKFKILTEDGFVEKEYKPEDSTWNG